MGNQSTIMSLIELFRHQSPVEIRFVDVDAFGHVNNAHYLTYLENARVRYFDEIVGWDYSSSGEGIILAHAEIDYLKPVRLGDPLVMFTRCANIGGKSLTFDYLLVHSADDSGTVMARAKTVLVAYDYTGQRTITVPDRWKEAIQSYEKTVSIKG